MAGEVSDENVILKKLLQFQNKGNYFDVTVTVGGKQYRAHKVVLAATSGYFHSLFNSKCSDNQAPNISSEEVVAVFGLILLYMYTGKIEITLKNTYNLLVASDFLVMEELKKHCVRFIEQNPLVEDTLKICYFATSPAGDSGFAKIAIKNVAINFQKIIETDDFLKIEFALLESILMERPNFNENICLSCHVQMQQVYSNSSRWWCPRCRKTVVISSSLVEDTLFSKLSDWITHSVVERLQYFPKLAEYVNLDAKYVKKWESLISQYTTKLTSQLCPSMEVNRFVKQSIHLYAMTNHQNLANLLWDSKDRCWMLYDMNQVPFYYVIGLVIGEKQYFLSQSTESRIVNRLWVGEKQGQWGELQSPPVFSDNYAIASISNTIYLYTSDRNPIRNYTAMSCVDFKEETGSRNIYKYVVDLDKWLAIPRIPKFFLNSYFVTANNMLFVIGGRNSYSIKGTKAKVVQVFDPRKSEWSERPLQVDLTGNGKACSYGNKIFICEVVHKQFPSLKMRNIYVYDVVLDKWETKTGEQDDATDVGALVVHDDCLWILPNSSRSSVGTYDLKSKALDKVSSISSSTKFKGVDCKISQIVDALVF